MNWLNPNCKWMIIGMSFTKFLFFMPIKNLGWPPPQDHRLTLDPIGKFSNVFSETTNMIKAKLYMNVHWMVLYTLQVFCLMIWNPRWPPPQVIVLAQDHMGKYRNIFFSEAIALIEPKLCINHWKVLYKLCFLCWSEFQDDYHCRT
jgi:hypothetical protein